MIYIGGDHRGFELKEFLRTKIIEMGLEVMDVGAYNYEKTDDYVDYASRVAEGVVGESGSVGIIICGSGAGVDMVANKFDGIRCALVFDVERTIQARDHENANVIALAADVLDPEKALELVWVFLETDFSGDERHQRRLEKMEKIEKEN